MLTVRFPNGQAVQYNSAYYVEAWGERNFALRDRKDGDIIAIVPKTCLVEWSVPCRVYNALKNEPDEQITRELKAINRRLKKLEAK